jgi:uncharacterized protein
MPGLGILAIPLMVIAVGDAKLSAGWLLPILCVADLFAIYYWRKHAAANRLFSLAPGVLLGVAGGAIALSQPERILRPLVGGIVLAMLIIYLVRRWRANSIPSAHPLPYGIVAGFATTVANAAGPVMNLYLLSKRLPKEDFVATGAWFFFFINILKVPVYAYHGLFSKTSLLFGVCLFPSVLAGALAGRWLIDRIPTRVFEIAVIVLTAASTALLFR